MFVTVLCVCTFWIVLKLREEQTRSLTAYALFQKTNLLIYKLWWFFLAIVQQLVRDYHRGGFLFVFSTLWKTLITFLMLFVVMFLGANSPVYGNEKWRSVFLKFQLLLVRIFGWISYSPFFELKYIALITY